MGFRSSFFHQMQTVFAMSLTIIILPSAHLFARQPNILLITIDTLRVDHVSSYDPQKGVTREIDAVGKKGSIFLRAFTHVPLTLPAHTSIMTGLTPVHHGVHDNAGFRLSPRFLTLAEWLKSRGYTTAAFIGAFPLDQRFGLNQGFDLYDAGYPTRPAFSSFQPERPATAVVTRVLAWLKNHPSQPWFIWVHVYDPHAPYHPPAPCAQRFLERPYAGEVACTDQALGMLFQYFRSKNQLDTMVTIIAADHGEALGDHGEETHGLFIYNETVHVPVMIVLPGLKQRKKIRPNVALSDIFPTIVDFLGEKKPAHFDGVSLLPLMIPGHQSAPTPRSRPIYLESLHAFLNRGWAPVIGLIWRNYKYIDTPIPEFYNLETDFTEQQNLKQPALIRQSLRLKLKKMAALDAWKRNEEDSETLEQLRSLGYIVGDESSTKRVFTPNDDPKRLLPLHNLLNRAINQAAAGQVRDAINTLKRIIERRPQMAITYHYLAEYYHRIGDLENAARTFQIALRRFPDQPSFTRDYGILMVEIGQYQKAVAILTAATRKQPHNPDVWNHLGIAYWKLQRYQEAQRAYQKALELDPDDAMMMVNLGNLALSQRHLKDAEAWFVRALKTDPNLPSAYNGMGAVMLKQGRVDRAIQFFRKGLDIDNQHPLLLSNLGFTLFNHGRRKQGAFYLQKYLEIAGRLLPPDEYFRIEAMIQKARHSASHP